jgi:hypothetical protein
MIEVLQGFPSKVVAFKATGQVSKRDYDEVLVPEVNQGLAHRTKLRCYYELGRDFTGMDAGAIWQDAKIGVEHFFSWERVAVVTDVEWIRTAINTLRFLLPAPVRIFRTTEAQDARTWISAGLTPTAK